MSLASEDKLREIIREILDDELEEANVTGNIDGGAGPPKTPGAFVVRKDGKKKKKKKTGYEGGHAKPDVLGYILVKEGKKIFVPINEGKYHDYRNNEEFTPKQKIGNAVRQIKYNLKELNKVVSMNVRLKKEMNVETTELYKRTHKDIVQIEGTLKSIATKLREMI